MKTASRSLFLGLAAILPQFTGAVDPLVDLGYTQLQGVAQSSGITQWLGVRYAAAPIGDLRFAAPEEPPSTNETVDATKVGSKISRLPYITLIILTRGWLYSFNPSVSPGARRISQ